MVARVILKEHVKVFDFFVDFENFQIKAFLIICKPFDSHNF